MSSWVSGRSALLRAALVSAAVGCGGETDSTSSSAGAAGAAGGGQGGSAAGGQGGSPQGGAAGKGGQAGSVPFPCKDPQPILIDGKDSGLDRCADGSTARRSAVTCPSQAPTAQKCPGQPAPEGGCAMDAECTAKPNGYCSAISGLAVFCQCAYGCTMDAECGAGEVCICGTPVGRCMKATCATNTDCGGGACKVSEGDGCGPSPGLACQGAADECGAPVDCQPGNACTLSEGHFACKGMCVAGRPLVVRGQARSAALLARAGWGLRRHGPGVGGSWSVLTELRFPNQLTSVNPVSTLVSRRVIPRRSPVRGRTHAPICLAAWHRLVRLQRLFIRRRINTEHAQALLVTGLVGGKRGRLLLQCDQRSVDRVEPQGHPVQRGQRRQRRRLLPQQRELHLHAGGLSGPAHGRLCLLPRGRRGQRSVHRYLQALLSFARWVLVQRRRRHVLERAKGRSLHGRHRDAKVPGGERDRCVRSMSPRLSTDQER